MTVVLALVALALGPPSDRGGHAVGPDRGGQALAVVGLLDGEPVTLVRDLPTFEPFVCIHGHEADWPDDDPPFWGGLQMDWGFMHTYGADMIRRHHGGLANVWTPAEQILVATRAWLVRGYSPWPATRIPCGV